MAVGDGFRESADSWAEVLRDLKRRGMRAPVLAIGDGALGFWGALREVFPETKEQRCWVHYADLRIMPTCHPPQFGWRLKGRHNHRLSRNARRESTGRKRPGLVVGGRVRARARSLSLRSAWR